MGTPTLCCGGKLQNIIIQTLIVNSFVVSCTVCVCALVFECVYAKMQIGISFLCVCVPVCVCILSICVSLPQAQPSPYLPERAPTSRDLIISTHLRKCFLSSSLPPIHVRLKVKITFHSLYDPLDA